MGLRLLAPSKTFVAFDTMAIKCEVTKKLLPRRSGNTLRFLGAAAEPPQANTTLVTKALPQDVATLAFVPLPHCGVSSRPFLPQESPRISSTGFAFTTINCRCMCSTKPHSTTSLVRVSGGW